MTTVFVDDLPPQPDLSLDYLHKNALWIIMDPWYPHPWPHDVEADPDIDNKTNKMVSKIVDYLPNLTHVKVSCPKRFPVHESLQHIENYYNETPEEYRADFAMLDYMNKNNIRDVVYIGFHLGRCILNKESGARVMTQYKARCWMKQDLVGVLATDDEDYMLNESKKWLYVI